MTGCYGMSTMGNMLLWYECNGQQVATGCFGVSAMGNRLLWYKCNGQQVAMV